jgi:tartrate-resistant acid phosphatase type 5
LLTLLFSFSGTPAHAKDDDDSAKTSGLNFLVVGDWGRDGEPAQRTVATQMAHVGAAESIKFVISTGDNFYPNGVASVDDPQWQTSFEQVYTDFVLHNDWYVVLGNHDYRGNPQAEIDYTKRSQRWHMPARYYTVTKSLGRDAQAEFFFVDTSPFIKGYQGKPDEYAIAGQDTQAQLKWLDDALSRSNAKWKFVIGHHHIYSGGKRSTQVELEQTLVPMMTRHGVQAYICGHEHDLQVIRRNGGHLVYLVSGTGSEHRPTGKTEGTLFSLSAYGFMAMSLTDDRLRVRVVDDTGTVRYTASIDAGGVVSKDDDLAQPVPVKAETSH